MPHAARPRRPGGLRRSGVARSAPHLGPAATSPCCARATRCSTARSCSCSSGWPAAIRSRSCPASPSLAACGGRGRDCRWSRATRRFASCRRRCRRSELRGPARRSRGRRDHQARPAFREGAPGPRRLGLLERRRSMSSGPRMARAAGPAAAPTSTDDSAPYFSMLWSAGRRRGREVTAGPAIVVLGAERRSALARRLRRAAGLRRCTGLRRAARRRDLQPTTTSCRMLRALFAAGRRSSASAPPAS